MHITPEMMVQTYELLRVTLPFRRWKLPHPDDITFRVSAHRDRHAHYSTDTAKGTKEICVSQFFAKDLDKLTQDIAHEIVHLRLDEVGDYRVKHGPKYQCLAAIVCRRLHWDLHSFING